jgi:MerR family transcriptional regulator, Zn(II)-responsive regulator of zntA
MNAPILNPRAPRLKIGAVARELGTTVRTLRYYEQQGLLEPPRTAGGTRLYSPWHVARFRAALMLIGLGIPLQDVVALTRARPGSPSGSVSSRKVLKELQRLRTAAADRKARLERLLQDIQRAGDLVATCLDCTLEPTNTTCPDCPCSTRFDESPLLALTWSVDD